MTASIVGWAAQGGNFGDAPINNRTIFQDPVEHLFTGNTALQGYAPVAFPAGIITPGGKPRGGYQTEVLWVAQNTTGAPRTVTIQFNGIESGSFAIPPVTYVMPNFVGSWFYRATLEVWPFDLLGQRTFVVTLEDGTSQVGSAGAQGTPVIVRRMTNGPGDSLTPFTVSPFQFSTDITNASIFLNLSSCTVTARSRDVP